MSAKAEKERRRLRMSDALDRIAATIPDGELLLATNQPGFFEAIAELAESKVRARVRALGRDMDGIGLPPASFVWVTLEVPIAAAKVCHGDYVDITPSAGAPS